MAWGSLNANTPKEKCSVKYRDLDYAVQCCIKLIEILKRMGIVHPTLVFAKSDLTSAFRILPLKIANFCWLVMYALDPKTNKVHFFVDKCLPFGASISCALFQKFSDVLCHITQFTINKNTIDILTNYLDDFLFLAATIWECNKQVLIFLSICEEISCLVSQDKMEWVTTIIVFLGILLNGVEHCLCVPEDKRIKAINMLNWFLENR